MTHTHTKTPRSEVLLWPSKDDVETNGHTDARTDGRTLLIVFTAQCTIVQSAVLLLDVVCLSIRL